MPYEVVCSPDKELGIVVLVGSVDESTIFEAAEAVAALARRPACFDVLWDCRRVSELCTNPRATRQLIGHVFGSAREAGRAAFLVLRDIDRFYLEMLIAHGRKAGREAAVFGGLSEAWAWLVGRAGERAEPACEETSACEEAFGRGARSVRDEVEPLE